MSRMVIGLRLRGQDELAAAADDAVLGEDQDVGVEVDDLGRDVVVEAADDRDDRHHGHHADDDAQERQARAQLVAAAAPGARRRAARESAWRSEDGRRARPASSAFLLLPRSSA